MTPAFHDNEGPPPVGYFTYSVVGDHWSWSDGMYALHGVQRECLAMLGHGGSPQASDAAASWIAARMRT